MDVLIVDDQADNLRTMKRIAEKCGYDVCAACTAQAALHKAANHPFPLIVLDIRLPDMDGLDLMRRLREQIPLAASDYILVTGYGDMDLAIQSFRHGAYDFIAKPVRAEEFAAVLRRAAEHQELLSENRQYTEHFDETVREATKGLRQEFERTRSCLRELSGVGSVIAKSKGMQEALAVAKQCHGHPDIPVLIEGETGTGKELIARLVHFGEGGCDRPFVDVSCSAVPRDLFESEFFGHESGAFTGSREKGQIGKLELADEGSLLLDDIADMPVEFQSKMLRVLQERTFYRVGGTRKVKFLARVIATSNRDLDEMVKSGAFRRDLLHRIRFAHIKIPPLRERPEDIAFLASFFLARESKARRRDFESISDPALTVLKSYSWPGNVRELEGAICRVVLCHNDSAVRPCHLDFLENPCPEVSPGSPLTPSAFLDWFSADRTLDTFTSEVIQSALERFEGNQSQAARHLGISRYMLRRKLDL